MTKYSILINEMSFNLDSGHPIFNKLNLVFSQHKIGLVGKNGIGKSTLLKLMIGEVLPSSGYIHVEGKVSYVPQVCKFDSGENTITNYLGQEEKINALQRILQGSIDESDFLILQDEWDIEERIVKQLAKFDLQTLSLSRKIKTLSGGELTRLLLVKAFSSNADFLLLDEPTNHLDAETRKKLHQEIQKWQGGLVIISHDRELLNLMDEIIELTTLGVYRYGGNYDRYREQKNILVEAQQNQLAEAKKFFHHTKRSIQSTKEKHEQRQARGRQLRQTGSQPKILLDAMKNRSTQSQGALLIRHNRMVEDAENKLSAAKNQLEISNKIKIDLPETYVPNGKIILEMKDVVFSYQKTKPRPLISHFNLTIQGPIRLAISGRNGSGKTTLIKLILAELSPDQGSIYRGTKYICYLDQDASLLNPEISILENFLYLNPDAKKNDAYRNLAQFLFRNTAADKLVKELSGGERLRALLTCVLLAKHPPQLLILDEPTNHLDIDSIENIESALQQYQGAMIIISHDDHFLKNVGIEKIVHAPFKE